ncbi:common pilus major fimbrillin subunit EcpA [Klebsiella sp. PL-2018]|uniref:common pilus major fimbrillin subunit EcpA n=1 Tax=Klebsiella sp. PL-2018 TaxID=2851540 RepID=UPI001C215C1A|nr:common pilus major fimbrillin subunit EcpA [Klebsiella sp. PL-2018]QXD01078.1 CFA/I fimbrial major subunit [Klebsiella sp. PL-2018]QXD01217.1 CFA/I fimbrial major subunit [Klebsiella sp. PL-2018]
MKKMFLVASLVSSSIIATSAMADVTASATASWDATATKDTTSLLTVTPLSSLTFEYAEALNTFNAQDSGFDVSITGQDTATDFSLAAKIISNTLIKGSGEDASTLGVGVAWNGTALNKTTDTVLVSTAKTAGLENLVANGAYNGTSRVSDKSTFKFTIESATGPDKDPVDEFAALPDGYWSGDVKVQFTATWNTPSPDA